MKAIINFIFLGCFFVGIAQNSFEFGWLPKVNLSHKLSKSTKWVNSIESRENIYDESFQFTHNLVDVSSIFSFKTDVYQSFNLGYILRFRNHEVIHRFVQHYNSIQKFELITLAHRFGFEQFFQSGEVTQFRTRYRINIQKALSGNEVDVKEWYVKVSNEYFYQFNKNEAEVRFSPYLGYQLTKKDRIEFGLDYRLGKVLETNKNNNLWFRTTWYISI